MNKLNISIACNNKSYHAFNVGLSKLSLGSGLILSNAKSD